MAIIAFSALVIYYLASALLTPDQPNTSGQPQIVMHNIIGQGERGTQLGWKFAAKSSDLSTDGLVTNYHHVTGGTYYLHGKPAYKITADEVTLDMRTQNYTAFGGVHIWSVRPRDLEDLKTQTVLWNNPLQTLTCPGSVAVKYKGYELATAHLTANFLTGASSLGTTSINANGSQPGP